MVIFFGYLRTCMETLNISHQTTIIFLIFPSNCGVRHREQISQVLVSLFVNDLEIHLELRGHDGTNIVLTPFKYKNFKMFLCITGTFWKLKIKISETNLIFKSYCFFANNDSNFLLK